LRWNNLIYTTTTLVCGIFVNIIILGLGVLWMLKLKFHNPLDIFIMSFLSISTLPFLFGNWIVRVRIFYDIPFQLPAANRSDTYCKIAAGNDSETMVNLFIASYGGNNYCFRLLSYYSLLCHYVTVVR
jgi:hypothetical protein